MTNGDRQTEDDHFELTLQHARDIGEIRTDVAGLKVGQDAGFANMQNQMVQLGNQFAAASKPKPAPDMYKAATLAAVILGMFGTVMVWITNQGMDSMEREMDLRFKGVDQREKDMSVGFRDFVQDTHLRFAADDERERSDAYNLGYATAKHVELQKEFEHLDAELHVRHRRDADWKLSHAERMATNETGLRADGEYTKEHANKPGNQGHPSSERVLKTEGALGVQQR